MKYQRICQLMIFIIASVFIFFSCPERDVTSSGSKNGRRGGGSSPAITTINFKPDTNNFIQYYTNDPAKLSPNGKTYWCPNISSDAADDFVETNVSKSSGKINYGYGVIFCIQDKVVDSNSPVNNFYALLIREDGYYCLIKVTGVVTTVNGVAKTVPKQHRVMLSGCDGNGWKFSSLLYKGWGVNNTIKITYNGKDSSGYSIYDVYFNGVAEATGYKDNFTADGSDTMPLFDGDLGKKKFGFIVTLGPDEDFPLIPVNVLFKQNHPLYNIPSSSLNMKSVSINLKANDCILQDNTENSGEFY